jgi:uncharacterized protein YhbP (UPF0306 family)
MEHLPEQRILDFIAEHHVLTLAVSNNNQPWCATCFYTYLPALNLFVFTSDHDTRHIRDVVTSENYEVAGAIALETRITGKIRGIQFRGLIHELNGQELKLGKAAYLKSFPIARLATLHLWGVVPDYIKMTDNRLGFGKKLIWPPISKQ